MNFCQITRWMSSASLALMPAPWHAPWKAAAAARCDGMSGPNSRPAIWPMCSITPGAAMRVAIYAEPPRTFSSPKIFLKRSTDSTPFWNGITSVLGPTTGRSSSAALSVSHSFTANITTSTVPPASAARSNTWTLSCAEPCGLFSVSPFSFSAARCLPRAKNTTSWPACCRRAPK